MSRTRLVAQTKNRALPLHFKPIRSHFLYTLIMQVAASGKKKLTLHEMHVRLFVEVSMHTNADISNESAETC